MAQDETLKRQTNIRAAIVASNQFLQAINTLNDLAAERAKFVVPIQDADMVPNDLTHLTAAIVGVLYDNVVPAIGTFILDVADGGRNGQILQQMRNQ